MTPRQSPQRLLERLSQGPALLSTLQQDITAYQAQLQERYDQLTRRVERMEQKVDDITNPDTPRNRKLLDEYERLSEAQAQSEEVLDELENLVLAPLWEAQEALQRLVS